MIAIQSLYKEYLNGTRALQGIDLNLKRGEFTVLLGPSGAGKSTLLRCINGLVEPSSGSIQINDVRVSRRQNQQVRKEVGMIFQQFNLVRRLTVIENVLCGCLAHTNAITSCLKLFPPEELAFALDCLRRVGLESKAYERADHLSGGQQQRVAIARALAQRASVILADEPVASLDPSSSERVLDILQSLLYEDDKTVVVSLHNVDLALRYGQRIIGMKEGHIVVDKPARLVTANDIQSIYEAVSDEEKVLVAYPRVAHG